MAQRLVNTTEELKSGMGAIATDLDFDVIASFVDDAENGHIIPAIGQEFYDRLREDDLDDKELRAKALLQKAITNFTVHNYSAFGAVQIDAAGILVLKTGDRLPASDKKLYQLRMQSRSDGFKALEAALIYLETYRDDFPVYIASDAHALNKQYYLNTTAEFSAGYDLQGSAEVFGSLRSVMGTVEENYIDPLLGNTLSTALRTAIVDGSTSTQQKKLIAKIAKPLALLTIAEAIPYRLVNIEPGGLITANLQGNTENVEASAPADSRRLSASMNALLTAGSSALGKLTKWLNDNAADYPGYTVQDMDARANINADGGGFYLL